MALSLIKEYISESDDEDGKNINDRNGDSLTERLPLPESISKWQGVTHHDEMISDPSKHDGRIRTFEHERGNWATLVYITYEPSSAVYSWMNFVKTLIHLDNVTFFDEFHLSLSRTLIVKFHWIDSIVDSLKTLCHTINKFSVELTNVKIYCNEERNRTFLGLCCINRNNILEQLTQKINELLIEYQLPPFYKDASYHISFMWCLGDQEDKLQQVLPVVSSSFKKFYQDSVEDMIVPVNNIQCKIGNRIYSFELR